MLKQEGLAGAAGPAHADQGDGGRQALDEGYSPGVDDHFAGGVVAYEGDEALICCTHSMLLFLNLL